MCGDEACEHCLAQYEGAAKRPDYFTLIRVIPVGRQFDAHADVLPVGWWVWLMVMSRS